MLPVYYIFGIIISIILVIIIGLNLSSDIETTIVYFLFWLLYILTILTIINIILSIYYYVNMRNKRGPSGIRGPTGDDGDPGDAGKCALNCRESICTTQITESIINQLQTFESKPIQLNNVFIRQKIKSICNSPEFQQMSPYKGANNLIKYLIEIWRIWIDLLYSAGGRIYFETIGAEMEWEWTADNPFDEMKKYDVFYWGLGKEYRPVLKDVCDNGDSSNIIGDEIYMIKTSTSNNMYRIGEINNTNDNNDQTKLISIWRSKILTYKGLNYYPIGDIAIIGSNDTQTITQKIKYSDIILSGTVTSPYQSALLVGGSFIKPPIDYTPIWNNGKIWIWRPIPPTITSEGEYISLGDIATKNANKPPTNEDAPVRCIALKILTKKSLTSIKQLWSSYRSSVNTNMQPATILSFNLPSKNNIPNELNAYNLFRCIKGFVNTIPASDKDAQFWILNPKYYDENDQPGKIIGNPPYNLKKHNKRGKGFIKSDKKDIKYSILWYLDLKQEMTLENNVSKKRIEISARNSINDTDNIKSGNIYSIKCGSGCVDVNNSEKSYIISKKLCNMAKSSQEFEIEMTGNIKGQCRLKHISSGKYFSIQETPNYKLISPESLQNNSNDTTIFTIIS